MRLKRKYAFDIDDTLCHFARDATSAMNKVYNQNYAIAENYQIHKLYGAKLEDFFLVLLKEHVYENIEPFEHSASLMNTLVENDVGIVFVTARSCMGPYANSITKKWIRDKLCLDNFELFIQDPKIPKVNYLDSSVEVFVEDNFEHLKHFTGKKYLINQPWNAKDQNVIKPLSIIEKNSLHLVYE
jgi:5'(3')-deoxyribonucleotidase